MGLQDKCHLLLYPLTVSKFNDGTLIKNKLFEIPYVYLIKAFIAGSTIRSCISGDFSIKTISE